jgi:aspartyl-tRNA(Asn)/glutamyl-tRNA(Gln) amidotransferase subunit A
MQHTAKRKLSANTVQRILLGTFALSAGYYEAYYGKAEAMINTLKDDFDLAFKTVDVFVCPTAPTVAYK